MTKTQLGQKKVVELRKMAGKREIPRHAGLNKESLINALYKSFQKEARKVNSRKNVSPKKKAGKESPKPKKTRPIQKAATKKKKIKVKKKVLKIGSSVSSSVRVKPKKAPTGKHVDKGLPLPDTYGQDTLAVLMRNPKSLYIYWELEGQKTASTMKTMEKVSWILIIDGPVSRQEFPIATSNSHWYFETKPGKHYTVSIGFYDNFGELHIALGPKAAQTSVGAVSDSIANEAEWMIKDFKKIVELSQGHFKSGGNSAAFRRFKENENALPASSTLARNFNS